MERTFFIRFLREKEFDEIITLGSKVHGNDYLTHESLDKILKLSKDDTGNNCSFSLSVNEDGKERVIGFRLTYAPSKWIGSFENELSQELWNVDTDKVAYFKSNTLDEEFRGSGFGRMLLDRSIAECKRMGATAGITHIWMQSPNNSAFRYFTRAGGKLVVLYPDYWNIDCERDGYCCVLCGNDCHCTAAEMILDLTNHKEIRYV